ncbi:hypothetical protein AB3U99_18420 [Niallia sp. JL1B1071]|uniref:hypothetical protein n=1 Tax=Niallia tiangongensis TaxID=3237105 RepID=UPI0037DD0021
MKKIAHYFRFSPGLKWKRVSGILCSFTREPSGQQAVVRYENNRKEALIVAHSFIEPKAIHIPINSKFVVEDIYGEQLPVKTESDGKELVIDFTENFQAIAFLLKVEE